jgi:hypothetical protein
VSPYKPQGGPRSAYVFDSGPTTVLQALNDIALHVGAVMIETSEGKISLDLIVPKVVAGPIPVLCKSDDLVSAELSHLPIYNKFAVDYEYNEAEQRYDGGFEYPTQDFENESFLKYGRLYPAPGRLSFRGFRYGNNESWVMFVIQALYRRHQDPRLVARVKTKIDRLGAELSDVYQLDSEEPTLQVPFMQPFDIGKSLTGDILVEMDLLDVSEFIRTSTEDCGYAYHDINIHDGCWKEF